MPCRVYLRTDSHVTAREDAQTVTEELERTEKGGGVYAIFEAEAGGKVSVRCAMVDAVTDAATGPAGNYPDV